MSFWKFSFASNSSIDTLLNATPLTAPSTPSNGLETYDRSTALLVTLEQLLQEDELIQECKSNHSKLVRLSSLSLPLSHSVTDRLLVTTRHFTQSIGIR
jgi:hypothetical protein